MLNIKIHCNLIRKCYGEVAYVDEIDDKKKKIERKIKHFDSFIFGVKPGSLVVLENAKKNIMDMGMMVENVLDLEFNLKIIDYNAKQLWFKEGADYIIIIDLVPSVLGKKNVFEPQVQHILRESMYRMGQIPQDHIHYNLREDDNNQNHCY